MAERDCKVLSKNLSSKKTLIIKVGAALIYGSPEPEISGFRNLVGAKSLLLKLTSLYVSFFIPTALFVTRTMKQIVKTNS